MKLTITGSGSGKPTAGKNHSSILLENEGHVVLIDCGEPVARVIAEKMPDPNSIEAVIITHFHPDHSSGIYMLLQLFHIQKRTANFKIFIPENKELFKLSLKMFYLFEDKFSFKISILSVSELEKEYNWLIPVENNHLKQYRKVIAENGSGNMMQSYSIHIKGDKQILYTADITSTKIFSEILPSIDLVILDALHPSANEITDVIDAGMKVVLNHGMNEKLDKTKIEKYDNVMIAEDGFEINI